MKNWILILFCISMLLSCSEKLEELTIEQEKMASVLADMHIAEEMLGKFREDDKDSVRNHYLNDIAIIHDLDTSVLFQNLEIIRNNPKIGIKVYSDVYEILNSAADIANEKK